MTPEALLAFEIPLRPGVLRERRSSYARRDWYGELDGAAGPHPVSAEAERRALLGEGRARFRRMLALSELLSASELPPAARSAWLELEATLHAHWLQVAREHYNLGVDAGLRRSLDPSARGALPVRDRLRALAEALGEAVEEL